MNARMQNAMRAMVAATVMTVSATTMASAVDTSGLPHDNRVDARTVAAYGDAAWLKPLAVVLDSKQAWDEWNAQAVANGWAVAVEAAPAGVDWKRDAVLVVALGESMTMSPTVALGSCRKNGPQTMVELQCSLSGGGSAAALVVALPRTAAHDVALTSNVTLADMPTTATYVMASTGGAMSPMAVMTSWGSLKADYR